MIINYNSLSRGRDAWLKNDVGEVLGSPPASPAKVSWKSWLLNVCMFAFLLLGVSKAWSQVPSYSFAQTSQTYVPVGSPASVFAAGWDDGIAAVTIPFSFTFNSVPYTTASVNSNGYITFGTTVSTGTAYTPISSTTAYAGAVSAFARDLTGGGTSAPTGSTIVSGIEGSAPNRVFVIQWNNALRYNGGMLTGDVINFQIRLYETTNVAEVRYGTNTATSTTSSPVQVGLRGASGAYINRTSTTDWATTIAGTTSGSTVTTTNLILPASGLTFSWAPPLPCTGTPDAGTVTPATQTVCSGVAPSVLTATGFTTGASGLTFQWQQSTDNGINWTNTTTGTGGTTAAFTPANFAGAAIQYRLSHTCTASGLTGYSSVATVSPPAAPVTQASALTIAKGINGFTASWTNGNGNRRLVIVSTSPINNPTDGSGPALTANAAYTSGQQNVFDGTGTSVSVTGLTCNTTYYVKVYEYQRCGTSAPYTYFYNVTSGTNATTVVPGPLLTTLPMINTFTGFTGANLSTAVPGWYEAKGTAQNLNPTGTVSDWVNTTLGGFTTAKLNLFNAAKNEFIISPKAAISAASRITFKAAITGFNTTAVDPERMIGTDDQVKVLISTDGCGAAWTVLYTFDASNTTTLTNVLTDYVVDIPASYIGQTVQIAFQANDGPIDNAPDYDFHIADIKVELTPSCSAVTGLNTSSVAGATANIAWTAPTAAPAGGYDYELRTSGAVESGATGLVYSGNEAALTHAFTGLTGLTAYTAYVRSHCGTGDTSAWRSVAFTTTATCLPVPTLTSANVFGTTATINWTAPTQVPTGGYDYELRTSGAAGSGATGLVFSGNETALTHNFTSLTALTAYTAYVKSNCGAGDTSTWKSVAFTTTATCLPIPTLTSANVGATTATINWTAPAQVPTGGYDYELRTSGVAGSGATGLVFSGNETVLTHNFTGLTALTAYTAYVRSNCGSSDFSTWRSLAITTLHANDICSDALTLTCGSSTVASLVGSTNESQPVCGISGLTTQNSAGIWYKILGNGNDMTVSTGSSATNVDTRLAIYSGACGTLTCIGGGDDISGTNYRSEVLFSTTAGTTYYILLYSFSSFTIPTDPITLTVTCTVPCSPVTTNDTCATAATATVGTPLATNNTCSAPSTVAYPSCGSSFGTYYDTWYSFNSGSNTTLEISTTSISPVVVGYAVYSGTCAGTLTQVGCNVTGAAANVTLTANTVYFIRAYSASTAQRGDFTLNVKVPCVNATAVTLASSTATTATFTWTAPASVPANGYQWEIRTTGAAGSGATGLVDSGNTTGLTATTALLTASTSYTFYLRSSCAVGDYSSWSTGRAFVTPCASVNVPYVQDFSSATIPGMPSCTTAINPGSGSPWVTSNEAYEGPVFPATQGNYLIYEYDSTDVGNAWFFTQGINLTANTAYAISYKYGNDGGELFPEKMKVAYGTSANVAGMTIPLADHPNIIAGNLNNQVIFTPTVSGVYFFGFNGYSDADMDILQLDDIKVDLAPTCIRPSAITSVSTVNGATFSWTPPATAPAIGYEWAVTTSDVPPANGATVTSATATAAGLAADTFYYFHVRSKCSASETSDWVTYSFITGYCMSTTTVPQNYYISSFSTTGAALNVTNASTYTARGYSNFSSQVIGNYPSSTTSFSLTPTNAATGTINSYGVSVFVDWNNDLDFDDANERVYSAPFSTSSNPRVGTFTVPAGTAYGNYRMRVRADFINSTTNVNACGGIQIGETEDYTFAVLPVPPAITSFTPTAACSSDLATTVVTITGTNFTGVTEVKLNDVVTPHTVVSDTSITVNLDAASASGFFNLYKSGDGSSTVSATPLEITDSPVVAPITGPAAVCLPASNTITLASETLTGVWSSSNVDVATVSSGGVVTPVAAGTVDINYTVTDSGCSTVVSYEVTVNNPIEITASTATQTVVTGGNTSFSVTATGSGAPSESGLTYQWQSTVDGETFVTLTNDAIYGGTNTNTLTLTNVPEELNLTLYNVIISGACTEAVSDLAVLFVGDTGIDTQPSPAVICNTGSGIASFTVEGSSDVTAYEWQEDRGGDNWQTLSDIGIYSGTTTPTLTLTGVTVANSGWKYKVIVTGISSAESNPVSLTVSQAAAVTSEPANQTVCYSGGTANFTVVATNAASYQWQYSADGSTWDNAVNGTPAGAAYSGTASATLNVTTTSAISASGTHQYRAIVNSATPCLPAYSASANLNINNVTINTQPVATSIIAGNTGSFTVAATTTSAASYQWQFSTTAGGTYQDVTNGTPANITYTGANSATLSVITGPQTEAGTTGRFYRVVVTSGVSGCSLASNGALLTTIAYCLPSFANGPSTVDGISNVTVGTLNNSSTHNNVAPYYTFFTGVNVPDLTVSSPVNVSVTYGTDADQFGGVWIDFNQNGTFDASEGVVSTTSAGASGTAIFAFNVPAGAVLGNTRMRVRGGNDSALTTAQACGVGGGSFGEAEDYIVNIIAAPPCATPVAGTITAGLINICGSGSTTLTATGYTIGQAGITFQWHNSAGPIAGANGFTYTTPVLITGDSYFFRATCANGGAISNSNVVNVNVVNPAITGTTPGSRCGVGTVSLEATGTAGSTLSWYSSATGGTLLGSGTTFTTPEISATTTYHVASEYTGIGTATVGTATTLTPTSGAPTAFNNYNSAYHAQYVFTAAELTAAGLRAGNITSVAFNVTTLGSAATNASYKVAIASTALSALTTTYVTTGFTTVYGPSTYTHAIGVNTVNFTTPYNWDGTSNIIVDVSHNGANGSASSATYFTATTANTVVWGVSSSSTTGNVSTSRLNMVFGGSVPCASARTAVVASITPPPALTLSTSNASVCNGASATVNVTSPAANFDSYVWTPAASGGSAATGFTFNPSVTTTYNLVATNASGCTNTATLVVTVNPLPTAVTVTPATPAICVGETVALTATGGMVSSAVTSGVGTSTSVADTTGAALGPNPLQNYYGGTKQQWIYRANELTALGFGSGSKIYSIALNLGAANTTPLTNLTVKMKNSSTQSFASTTAWETGMTEVISQISHTPAVGLNTFTLPTPFVWDGTSSLVVEMNYSNNNGGSGTTNTAKFSATTYTSTIFYRVDNATRATINGYTGTATATYSSRNDIVFVADKAGAITWTPTTGLYTDAGATTPYTGGNVRVVYAKPAQAATYSAAVVTAEGCPGATGSATITINTPTVWYVDADNDNYGNSALPTVLACTKPAFYAAVGGDCNDSAATGALVNPGMAEIFYNGIDDNCDGNIDEGRQLTTALLSNMCGTKLTKIYHTVSADWRTPGVNGYRFRITNLSDTDDVQIKEVATGYFSFNQLARYEYGTAYKVEVELKRNNIWLGYYGPACTVTTPDIAKLYICGGTVAAKGTAVFSEVLLYATAYRFEVTNLTTNQVTPISNGHHYFTFNEVPGFTAGGQYSVKVSVQTTGDWSAYGAACTITAPGGSGPEIPTDKIEVPTSNVFKVAAYPNPYAEAFGLNITTESNAVVNVKVYDMLGKLIEIRNASVTDLKEQRIGERYSAGVYNIIVTQEENVKTLRVIKR